MIALALLLAFLPVTSFLIGLLYLDSFKLVSLRRTVLLIVSGSALAGVSFAINQFLRSGGVDPHVLRHFAGPAVEETLKALPILLLLRRKRIGFLIDAAICGFAVGAGFALAENVYYLTALHNTQPSLWVVRGFGTAMMHGGTTSILAMITKGLSDRRGKNTAALAAPGIGAAFFLHSLFNHFLLSPAASAVVIVLFLPPLIVLVFSQSERSLQRWLGSGFDLECELLKAIRSGDFADSHAGHYLQSLRDHFDGPAVADMLCYLRIRAELALRAKGVLMLRESGLPVRRDTETADKLAELRYLEKSIGKTGKLALVPILHQSHYDLWQLQMLESEK